MTRWGRLLFRQPLLGGDGPIFFTRHDAARRAQNLDPRAVKVAVLGDMAAEGARACFWP